MHVVIPFPEGLPVTRNRDASTTVDDEGRLGLWAEFELLDHLGHGGFGHVYRARRDGRELALKIPWPPPGRREATRFVREQQFAADLHHPNVIEIEEVGRRAAGPFIAMELIPGGDLARRILQDQGSLEIAFVRTMVRQIAAALDYVHARGPVHRDVKPNNILLDFGGGEGCRFVLADFGIAKAPDRATTSLTRTGAHQPGTRAYSAPEQLERGSRDIDRRADVYALGCVAYESLTGRRPYERQTVEEQLEAIGAGPPHRVSSMRPGLAAALDDVIERALSPSREDRQPSAGALASEIAATLRPSEPPRARRAARLEPDTEERRPSAPRPSPEMAGRRPSSPRPLPPLRRAPAWQRAAVLASALALASATVTLVVVIGGVAAVAGVGVGVSVLVAATPFVRRRDHLMTATTAEEPVRLACTRLPGWHRNAYLATARSGHVRLTQSSPTNVVSAAALAVGCVLPALTYALVWRRRPAELVLDARADLGRLPSQVTISARGVQGLRAATDLRRELERRGSHRSRP